MFCYDLKRQCQAAAERHIHSLGSGALICREQRVEIAVRVTFWLASALTGYDLEEASLDLSRP